MATVCEASELLKQRIIPPMSPPNDAPEAVCKLPAKIPTMAALDIRAAYEFTATELDTPITPEYVEVDGSNPPATAEDCVENTDVSTGKFTWVDWLTPVKALEGDRHWIIDTELECTEDGDLSEDTAFKRPALPMNQYTPVLPTPIAPALAIPIGTGGGGGGSGECECEELVEIIDNKLYIHPFYINMRGSSDTVYEFMCGPYDQKIPNSPPYASLETEEFPLDFSVQEDGLYYVWAYGSGSGRDADNNSIPANLGFFTTSTSYFQVTIPTGVFQRICTVRVENGKISLDSILCSKMQDVDIYPTPLSANSLGVLFQVTNSDRIVTPSDVEIISIYIGSVALYPIHTIDRYTGTTSIYKELNFNYIVTDKKARFIIVYYNFMLSRVEAVEGNTAISRNDALLVINNFSLNITGYTTGLLKTGYPVNVNSNTQFIIKVIPDYAKATSTSLPFTLKIQQSDNSSIFAGVANNTNIPLYEKSLVSLSSESTHSVSYYLNLFATTSNNPTIQITKNKTMGSVLIGSIRYGGKYNNEQYPILEVTQSIHASTSVNVGPLYTGPFCVLPTGYSNGTFEYVLNPAGSTRIQSSQRWFVNGLTGRTVFQPFYFSTKSIVGYVEVSYNPPVYNMDTGNIKTADFLSAKVKTGTPSSEDPVPDRNVIRIQFSSNLDAETYLYPLPPNPVQFFWTDTISTTVLMTEILREINNPEDV